MSTYAAGRAPPFTRWTRAPGGAGAAACSIWASPPHDAFSGIDPGTWSLWRYRQALPFSPSATGWQAVSMGEGATPLIAFDGGLRLKLDFVMPTLSFKDRGSVVLVAKAAEIGVRRLVADSSGNAGASIAAYAARAGIEVEVFVPAATSQKKVAQLRGYGATVHCVAGARAQAASAAMDRVASTGAFYASHVYNPLFHHGTKTFAFELWEQLGGRLPGTVLVPAGNGTLLIGAALGFGELAAAGLVERLPRLVAVQAERCAPLADAARLMGRGGDAAFGLAPRQSPAETLAEGIAIAEPARLAQMLDVVSESGGDRAHGDRTGHRLRPPGAGPPRGRRRADGGHHLCSVARVARRTVAVVHRPRHDRCGPKSPPPSHPAATAPQPGRSTGHDPDSYGSLSYNVRAIHGPAGVWPHR